MLRIEHLTKTYHHCSGRNLFGADEAYHTACISYPRIRPHGGYRCASLKMD